MPDIVNTLGHAPPIRSFSGIAQEMISLPVRSDDLRTEGWIAVFLGLITKAPQDWLNDLEYRNALLLLIMLYEHVEGENACPSLVIHTEDGILVEKSDREFTIEMLCQADGTIEYTVFYQNKVIEMKSVVIGRDMLPLPLAQYVNIITDIRAIYACTSRVLPEEQ